MPRLPTFQPQNPSRSGYYLGWQSCTSFSSAMAAAYHRQVGMIMTGGAVRNRCRNTDGTPDRTGGTNLSQNDRALTDGWGINLDVYYRLSWASFERAIDAGRGAVLQHQYGPIADSRFDAGNGFRAGHAMFVPSGWQAMDPLADGRYDNVYRFRKEPYPRSLLKEAAGKFDLNGGVGSYRPLGHGYVYAMFTRDVAQSLSCMFLGGAFWVYVIGQDGKITSRHSEQFSGPTSAPCSSPEWHAWPGHPQNPAHPTRAQGRSLVRITAGALAGQYVGVPQSSIDIEVVP